MALWSIQLWAGSGGGYTPPSGGAGTWDNDWINEDGLVGNLGGSIVYTPSTAGGSGSAFNPAYIVVNEVYIEEPADSWGKYRRWVASIQIPTQYMVLAPKPRDEINWGFTLYSGGPTITFQVCKILEVPYLGSPWAFTADYLDFQALLDDTVTLIQATCSGSSSTGSRTVTDTTDSSFTGIAAAIEPREQRIGEMFGAITDPEYYDIYLSSDPSPANSPSIIKVGDMLQDQNGIQYEIIGSLKRERLDLKPQFLCVKKL